MTDGRVVAIAAAAWAQALRIAIPAGDRSFFELGGDSIAAMEVAAILGPTLTGVPDAEEAVLMAVFQYSTLPTFAGWLAGVVRID